MKKILTHLTGIVLLITILAAGACSNGFKQKDPTLFENDSTRVICLKETLIDGRMHLEMYNSLDPDKVVIDHLYTDVQPGYTVIWMNAEDSKIKRVIHIRPIEENGKIFSEDAREVKGLKQLKIPSDATPGEEKYEIVFTVKRNGEKEKTWCIDPYLKIPPQD